MGKIAFVFAGQGAQSVGMGLDLYENIDAARTVFDAAGDEVKSLCFTGPADLLNQTLYTQPCVYSVDYAAAQALRANGLTPDGVAGFSLGELAALAFASVFSFEDGLEIVRFRSQAMQRCSDWRPGVMFAVLKLTDEQVESLCGDLPNTYPVNYNHPGQIVVACPVETAGALQQAVTAAGGKAIQLRVSGAFHNPCMNDAAQALAERLVSQTVASPSIPVYANINAMPYSDIKKQMAQQVNHPVRWLETVRHMIADGFDTFIEVGPGKTLTGIIRHIDKTVQTHNVYDTMTLQTTLDEVKS